MQMIADKMGVNPAFSIIPAWNHQKSSGPTHDAGNYSARYYGSTGWHTGHTADITIVKRWRRIAAEALRIRRFRWQIAIGRLK